MHLEEPGVVAKESANRGVGGAALEGQILRADPEARNFLADE